MNSLKGDSFLTIYSSNTSWMISMLGIFVLNSSSQSLLRDIPVIFKTFNVLSLDVSLIAVLSKITGL